MIQYWRNRWKIKILNYRNQVIIYDFLFTLRDMSICQTKQ